MNATTHKGSSQPSAWRLLAILVGLAIAVGFPTEVLAEDNDKSGIRPQVISLPSGPGSLEGLGESFEPQLNTGTASYPVKFTVPPGRAGFQPELAIHYDGGNANSPFGMGWKLNVPYIQRQTDQGLPAYDDSDRFIDNSGAELVQLTNGDYRYEVEGRFMRFRRLADDWEAHSPSGTRYVYGASSAARVTNQYGIFRWHLERQIDTNGNEIHYHYIQDGGYRYLSEIRYSFRNSSQQPGEYNAVILKYEARPDVFADRRSRARVAIGLRTSELQMWAQGSFVRSYQFSYAAANSTGQLSLLHQIIQIGDDGISQLPPHTFTYTQFDPSSHTVVSMQSPPPVSLLNADADLVDINGDGLPDLFYTPNDGHRYYLNRGQGRWQSSPSYPNQSPTDQLSSPNASMADMNGDGHTDLLVRAGLSASAPFYYYASRANREWEPSDRVDYDVAPNFALNDPNLRLVDTNNDKLIDVMLTSDSRISVWLAHTDNTWSKTADWVVPALAVGTPLVFSDPHVKLGDMTGDRLQDMVYVRDGEAVYFPYNGNGDYGEPIRMVNPPSGIGDLDSSLQLGDLNNDGLSDLILPTNRFVVYWLNLGNDSFAESVQIDGTPFYNPTETALRLVDIDGDGMTELLYSRFPAPEDEAMQYLDFHTGPQPFLLQSVDNGLGRTIHIEYKSSIVDYIADADTDNPWETTLPFPVQVVSRVTVHDANSGDDYVIDYSYRNGYYDGEQKEFRGFERSVEIKQGDETAATTITRYRYDTGKDDESRKGLMLESEVLGQNGSCSDTYAKCYSRTTNQITTRILHENGTDNRVVYSFINQTDSYIHEQQAEPAHLRQIFDYDGYGNLIHEFNYGLVCGPDESIDLSCGNDERLKTTVYAVNEDTWIMNFPSQISQTDLEGNFVSESRLYYDGEAYVGLPLGQVIKGNLSRREENLGPLGNSRFISTERKAFDSYGNPIGMMDANGNRITVEYDALTQTFPVLERIHLDEGQTLSYAASYHVGFGKVTNATDFNGHVSTYLYDTVGRIQKIVLPGDSLELPTQEFVYDLSSPRSAITTHQREQSGTENVLTSVTYFDGLGRTLQTRSEAENNHVVVTDAATFNARQSIRSQFQPYYDNGFDYVPPDLSLPQTQMAYDPIGRAIRTTNPDGSFATVTHQPLVQVQYDEEDNRADSPHFNTPKTLFHDGLERLIGVKEVNIVNGIMERYNTAYSYDLLDNLTQIVDDHNNIKIVQYDGLSRKTYMDDPNRGEMHYLYDDNGNLLQTIDAKAQVIRRTYDAANRVLTESWGQSSGQVELIDVGSLSTVFTWHYDEDLSPRHPDADNTLGQVTYIEDGEGAEYFTYDPRGNLAGKIRYFSQEGLDFVRLLDYDAMDRVTAMTYPDGFQTEFHYNAQGLLEKIPGFVDNVDYIASSQRDVITYPNGATTRYEYDNRLRLTHLHTLSNGITLQDLNYTFDDVSNITAIVDGRATRTAENDHSQSYSYDSLYRLTQAAGTYGQLEYGYNSIGNMIRKTSTADDPRLNLGKMKYGENGAGPHALTKAGANQFTYDGNGNQLSNGNSTHGWNARNWLDSVTEAETTSTYAYNSAGQRIRQQVTKDSSPTTTLYADRYTEVRGEEFIRYVFVDANRVSQSKTAFVPSALLIGFSSMPTATNQSSATDQWYISDHLGGSNLVLDSSAEIVSEILYYPFGATRYQVDDDEIAYQYTGKELDATGLHYYGARYYNSISGRFISIDPLYAEQPGRDLANPQSLNLYAYVGNNPIVYTDPTGFEGVHSRDKWTQVLKYGGKAAAGVFRISAGIGLAKGAAVIAPFMPQLSVPLAISGGLAITKGAIDTALALGKGIGTAVGVNVDAIPDDATAILGEGIIAGGNLNETDAGKVRKYGNLFNRGIDNFISSGNSAANLSKLAQSSANQLKQGALVLKDVALHTYRGLSFSKSAAEKFDSGQSSNPTNGYEAPQSYEQPNSSGCNNMSCGPVDQ